MRGSHAFKGRFAFVYGVLAACAAFAVVAGVYEMTKPGPPQPAVWPWTPAGSPAEVVRQIAAHVGAEYAEPDKKGADHQLTEVRGGALQVKSETIHIARTTNVPNQVMLLDGAAVQYTLCGPNDDCSFPNDAPADVDVLMRREGLELALYTFRNVSDIENVVVFFPPQKGQQRTRAMFFRRNDVVGQLNEPLRLPGQSDGLTNREVLAVAQRTDPFMYRFQIAPVSGADGQSQPAVVVDPEGLDGKTDQSPPTSSIPTGTTPAPTGTSPTSTSPTHTHTGSGGGGGGSGKGGAAKRSP